MAMTPDVAEAHLDNLRASANELRVYKAEIAAVRERILKEVRDDAEAQYSRLGDGLNRLKSEDDQIKSALKELQTRVKRGQLSAQEAAKAYNTVMKEHERGQAEYDGLAANYQSLQTQVADPIGHWSNLESLYPVLRDSRRDQLSYPTLERRLRQEGLA